MWDIPQQYPMSGRMHLNAVKTSLRISDIDSICAKNSLRSGKVLGMSQSIRWLFWSELFTPAQMVNGKVLNISNNCELILNLLRTSIGHSYPRMDTGIPFSLISRISCLGSKAFVYSFVAIPIMPWSLHQVTWEACSSNGMYVLTHMSQSLSLIVCEK